jgi:hypothetical protein
MHTQQLDNMKKTETIALTVRVPIETANTLEEEARRRRQESGDNVGRADVIREAVRQWMERQGIDQ